MLLQRGLPIVSEARLGSLIAGGRDERAEARDDEVLRWIDAAVEIDRRDERLEAVGEDRVLAAPAGLLLAAPEQHVPSEIDVTGEPRERRRGDDARFHFRFVAFAVRRESGEQQIGDHEAE